MLHGRIVTNPSHERIEQADRAALENDSARKRFGKTGFSEAR
jgi:hypothetical protein